jgi:hypothetical protein
VFDLKIMSARFTSTTMFCRPMAERTAAITGGLLVAAQDAVTRCWPAANRRLTRHRLTSQPFRLAFQQAHRQDLNTPRIPAATITNAVMTGAGVPCGSGHRRGRRFTRKEMDALLQRS